MTTSTPDSDATARAGTEVRFTPRPGANEAQFAPGTIIAGRYRIASILGAGGMGEVYRADDTKLGQQVALKFLPARLARDPMLLERLHDEVRLGRLITHPNVCRIYDIVDWENAHFVAMEYVDGEDLSRLLRRIGRLAHDKAVDITRGIAAGLAAAHAKGILHRDLKPANVMIDSHGEARIMDFGLALTDDSDSQNGVIAGTPAYMAPEQLAGQPATVQSDLYSLGLVMYELFTGKRAHNERTLPERVRNLTSEITNPSSVIRDLDPAVERVILRCLAKDPAERPRSARDVIDALPGGDPLAAALAAGETPSPRVVAAAGSEGSLRPAVAWSLLALVFALFGVMVAFAMSTRLPTALGMDKPPEVQRERAKALLRGLGIPEPKHSAYGYQQNWKYKAWLAKSSRGRIGSGRARGGVPLLTFWVREESEPMFDARLSSVPKPSIAQPPMHGAGATTIEIDPHGRLVSLRAIASVAWPARTLDWNAFLATAGLRGSSLTPEEPRLLPPSFADVRKAWSGRHPDDGTPIRVEAAAWRGVPVFFRLTGQWDDGATAVGAFGDAFTMFTDTVMAIAVIVGALLAWRNIRQRRGDRAGAIRVATVVFILALVRRLALSWHDLSFAHEMRIAIVAVSAALYWAVLFAMIYIALEPYVRRRWPDRLIAWARLLAGNWRDPMVGRDVLIGIAAGLGHAVLSRTANLASQVVSKGAFVPYLGEPEHLDTPLTAVGLVAQVFGNGIAFAMTLMVMLMLLTMLLRRRPLAVGAFFVLTAGGFLLANVDLRMYPLYVLIAALFTLVTARYGLLALVAMHATFLATFIVPLPDAFAWYTARTLVLPIVILALALWAFRSSLGSRPLFALESLDG